jgi:hypothetical protein
MATATANRVLPLLPSDLRLGETQIRGDFLISLDPNLSGPMDPGPQEDRLFLLCPPILNFQRGLSL